MARVFSYPFRLTPAGAIATVEADTDEAHREELAVAILTRRGERSVVPEFGLPDPAFDAFDGAELVAHVEAFGPPVEVLDVEVDYPTDTVADVVVRFD